MGQGFALNLLGFARRRRFRALAVFALVCGGLVMLSGCGDKYPGHVAPGVYSIPIMAVGTSQGVAQPISHTVVVTLTVTP